jgi:hypothetical protein
MRENRLGGCATIPTTTTFLDAASRYQAAMTLGVPFLHLEVEVDHAESRPISIGQFGLSYALHTKLPFTRMPSAVARCSWAMNCADTSCGLRPNSLAVHRESVGRRRPDPLGALFPHVMDIRISPGITISIHLRKISIVLLAERMRQPILQQSAASDKHAPTSVVPVEWVS